MMLVSLIDIIAAVLFAIPMQGLIDTAVSHDMSDFKGYLTSILALFILSLISAVLSRYSTGRFGEDSLYYMRTKTMEKVSKLPIAYFDNHNSADLVSRLTNDMNAVQSFLQGGIKDIILQPILFTMSAVYLIIINWKLTIFSFILIPLFMWITVKISKPVEKYSKGKQEALSDVNVAAQDAIGGIAITKSFTLEEILQGKYENASTKAFNSTKKVAAVKAAIEPVRVFMQIIPFMLVMGYGGYLTINGEMTLGSLTSYIMLSNYIVNPLGVIPRALADMRSAKASIGRIYETWDEDEERQDGIIDLHKGMELSNNKTKVIRFDDVRFSYDGKNELLNGLSFEIDEGQTVAIVGPSGCGKSTVMKLLTGFYTINGGDIYIYGKPISSWNLDALRSFMSIVSQETYLFPESIYNNIAYGKKGCLKGDVINAAMAADIHEFVSEQPKGYDTIVGERGVKLSGGQRQRIAIARALLKDAPILLLDEATSSLDTQSEHDIQNELSKLAKGRTTLVIAHRLSTIKNADNILVMNNGIIIQRGTHEQLVSEDGLYRNLYYEQFEDDSSKVG